MRFPRPLIAAVALGGLVAASCDGGDDAGPSPSPRDTITASPVDSPAPAPTGTGSPTASPTVSPTASPTPREPTDTDRARFIAGYEPESATDLEAVAEDVDGDDVREVVFVYVRTGAGVSRVEVAWWDPEQETYAVEWSGDGGPAERVDRIRLDDINADGRAEIAVSQSIGSSGASLSLWRSNEGVHSFSPLVAVGGCHDGSHTYGVVGASLSNEDDDPALEVLASCDDSPLPVAAWSTDVYDWADGAYHFSTTRFPGE